MALNVMLKKNVSSLIIVFTVFFLDRLSKYIILDLSHASDDLNFSVTSFINFNLVWNKGIAFGLFSFDQSIYYNLITLIIVLVTSAIIWFALKSKG